MLGGRGHPSERPLPEWFQQRRCRICMKHVWIILYWYEQITRWKSSCPMKVSMASSMPRVSPPNSQTLKSWAPRSAKTWWRTPHTTFHWLREGIPPGALFLHSFIFGLYLRWIQPSYILWFLLSEIKSLPAPWSRKWQSNTKTLRNLQSRQVILELHLGSTPWHGKEWQTGQT